MVQQAYGFEYSHGELRYREYTEYRRDICIQVEFVRSVEILLKHIASYTLLVIIYKFTLNVGQQQQEQILHNKYDYDGYQQQYYKMVHVTDMKHLHDQYHPLVAAHLLFIRDRIHKRQYTSYTERLEKTPDEYHYPQAYKPYRLLFIEYTCYFPECIPVHVIPRFIYLPVKVLV